MMMMSAPSVARYRSTYDEWSGPFVRLIGSFAIFRDPEAARPSTVGGGKARTLLAVLAVHQDRVVAVDRLVDALWPDRRPHRPEAGVSTLVSRLRARFGATLISGDRNGYRLGREIRVDLYEAAELIAEAEAHVDGGHPELCLRAAEPGLRLLEGGPVLSDAAGAPWAQPAVDLHTGLLRRGRHIAAEAALRSADAHRAYQIASAAIIADPLDEVAYRALIRAHAAAGDPDRALDAYRQLRDRLAADLGIDPAPATRDLYRSVGAL